MAKENHNSQDDMDHDEDAGCVFNWTALSDVSDRPLIIDEDYDTVETQAGCGTQESVFLHHDDSYIGTMEEIQNHDSTEQSVSGESEQSQDPELDLFSSDSFDHQSDEYTDSRLLEMLASDLTEDAAESSGSALSDRPLESYIIGEDHDTVETQAGGGTQKWVFIHHDDLYNRVMEEIQNLDLLNSDPCDHQSDESTDSCPPELLDHDATEDAAEPSGRSTPVAGSFSPTRSDSVTTRAAVQPARRRRRSAESRTQEWVFFQHDYLYNSVMEEIQNARSDLVTTRAAVQPARRRRRTMESEDVQESLTSLRLEQVSNFVDLDSKVKEGFSGQDEFSNCACAVADSLRKLPANGPRTARRKLFAVLDEAHGL